MKKQNTSKDRPGLSGFFMRRKDLVLLILAIVVLVFSLVKLGGKKAIEEIAAPVLVFTYSWEGKDEILNNIKDEFELQYPDINVRLVYKPYNELKKLLFDDSGNVIEGDVITTDPLWAFDLMMAEKIEPEIFPVLRFFYPLFYNIEILKQAGFSGPPKTRSEFLAQAKAVTKPEAGVHAIAFALAPIDQNLNPYRDLYSWIWAASLTFFNPETQRPRSLSRAETETLRETLNFFVTLHNENLLLPETFSLNEKEKRQAFLDGKTAFMIASAENMELLRQGLGGAFDYTAIPIPDTLQTRPIFGQGGWDLAINSSSALKEHSLQFISFLIEHSPALAQGWAIPYDSSPIFSIDTFYSKAQELYISGDLVQDFSYAGPQDMDAVFRQTLIDLFEGKIDVAEAVIFK